MHRVYSSDKYIFRCEIFYRYSTQLIADFVYYIEKNQYRVDNFGILSRAELNIEIRCFIDSVNSFMSGTWKDVQTVESSCLFGSDAELFDYLSDEVS